MISTYNLNISKQPNFVHTYRDLSFGDTRAIVNLSKTLLGNINPNSTINDQKAVSRMIGRVNHSIQNRSIGRKILDIITFQFIKVILLKRELPNLIQTINRIAGNNINPNPDDTDDYDTTVKNNAWEDDPEFKLDLMFRAYEHFKKQPAPTTDTFSTIWGTDRSTTNSDQWKKTAEEVDNFFQDRIGRLSRGENIAIPIYYHASRAGTDLIAGSSTLKQSGSGVQNAGVYFSTSDESHNAYGPCTFAMDPAQVEKFQTTYLNSGMPCLKTGEEVALWMCAKQDIQLKAHRLAYVIVPEDGGQTIADKIKKFWEDGDFFVELITRPAADEIRKSIKAVHIHSVPQHWRNFSSGRRSTTGLNHIVAD
jgi:hypothetical protein